MKKFILALFSFVLIFAAATAAEDGQIRIAFLDSGISLKHIDAKRVAEGENFVFPGNDTDDRIGHGTATAGIVLGSDSLSLTGLCPTAVAVPLVLYDAYPTGVTAPAEVSVMARAIRAAVDDYNCRIINISMGTTEESDELRAAVEYARGKGAIIVSAVGNAYETAPERVYYPAAYDGVIGVGAADGDIIASFSQRLNVDLLAPGVRLDTVTNKNAAKSEKKSGTSYACAYVSGSLAAIWAETPELSADEVAKALFATARDVGKKGYDTESGWGVIGPEKEVAFSDVFLHAEKESIELCAKRGIMSGVGNGRFSPDTTMSRAMMVTALYRLAGCPYLPDKISFSDVGEDDWYFDAVNWAVEVGIVFGMGDGTFSADGALTYEQAGLLLERYGNWANAFVPEDENENKTDIVTRAGAAKMLSRLCA